MFKNGKEIMDFHLLGKLPANRKRIFKSPLINLLSKIPPRELLLYKGIRLSSKVGYTNGNVWSNGAILLRWLKSDVGDSWRIKQFSKRLTIEELRFHCRLAPGEESQFE